jgi:hypothetical protein
MSAKIYSTQNFFLTSKAAIERMSFSSLTVTSSSFALSFSLIESTILDFLRGLPTISSLIHGK